MGSTVGKEMVTVNMSFL